ncbi:splicing factor 3A subunit 1-like [Clytia hemisphaerica]|uniref:splicing factor 3A subunit 1-like n=1 Tax=Clytia hemisphaerica TaxID=252671 RepID=UPI0034D3F4E2
MGPAVPIEQVQTETSEDGKIYERSQQDGEMYSKPTVGIIYPPPEVRNIVDRTANFVARNGPEFEERIRGNEADNPKFNFLNPNDPYHAYYAHKLKEYRETDIADLPSLNEKEPQKAPQTQTKKQAPQVIETIIPKDPPPAYEFTADPPTISALDLDIVKLTAQFVAKNGKGFLTNLMTREQRNYQFDFLRPQHSLFQYFTRLVEQYTKVLLPPGDITQKLQKDLSDQWKVLDTVKYRVEWQQYQDREKRKVEDEKERERIAFASIDWHDFVVVETVNFNEEETANLPPPVKKDQLGARMLQEERIEKLKATGEDAEQVEMDVEEEEEELYQPYQQEQEKEKADSDMDEESDEEEAQPPAFKPPMMPPPPSGPVHIRKYDPKASKQPQPTPGGVPEKYLISPLTGEKIPVGSMESHMKIALLDPRWKEQKEKAIEEKRQQEQVFAEGHISDKGTFKILTFVYGNGGSPSLIIPYLHSTYHQNKKKKRFYQIKWICNNLEANSNRCYKMYYNNNARREYRLPSIHDLIKQSKIWKQPNLPEIKRRKIVIQEHTKNFNARLIHNLSDHNLTNEEHLILCRGLNYSPGIPQFKFQSNPTQLPKLPKKRKSDWTPPTTQNETINHFFEQLYNSEIEPRPTGRRQHKHILTPYNSLLNNHNIIIKKADKGGGLVIHNKKDYIDKINKEHLNNTDTYQELEDDPTQRITYDPHRQPITLSCTLSATTVESLPAYLKDTKHFLQLLDTWNEPLDNITMITADVTSLYTKIPHDEGLEATTTYYANSQDILPDYAPNVTVIKILLDTILTNSNFRFMDKYYLQRTGTTMGGRYAPQYANLFMGRLEKEITDNHNNNIVLWRRFIDDIFILFKGSHDDLQT